MQPPHQHSRINLGDMKAQIVKKLGPEGSKQYFYYLNRFLSLKLSKVEFTKLCLRILGRENLPLHNQFIRSILRNACTAESPPPSTHKDDVSNHGTQVSDKDVSGDGYPQNGSHNNKTNTLSNGGDVLPVSPRKVRTSFRDRRTGDRRSALGVNGKINFAPQSDFNVVLENGDLNPPDIKRRSLDNSSPVYSMDQTESVVKNEGRNASMRSPIQAPLGIPLCPVSIGGARKALPTEISGRLIGKSDGGGALMDSLTLRERMEQIASAHGLEGVSVDCANILNHGLDTYMKGLLRSCIELGGESSGSGLIKSSTHKHHTNTKLINGVKPGHQFQMQNTGKSLEVQEQSPISLQDFRVAMEMNPRQLGEEWPLLLEKICTRAFEE